jgi:uncharacterized protein (DUF1330 family)
MSAYFVGSFLIKNPEPFAAYPPAFLPTIVPHGGEVIVADLDSEVLEGEPMPITIVMRFPDKASIHAWYDSPEYQSIIHLRHDNADGTAVIVDEFNSGG